MSKSGSDIKPPAKVDSKTSSKSGSKTKLVILEDESIPKCCRPDFIYGGPFIVVPKKDPFLNIGTPINIQLQGTFKKSYAYASLKDRMPVILTKIIDNISKGKGGNKDILQKLTQIKHDLMTNKEYEPFTEDTDDARKWNSFIDGLSNKHYFTNAWVFSECYIYRKLREACVLNKMESYDPFEEQKNLAFSNNLEPMCIVAEKILPMMDITDREKRKADYCTILKLCLWSNKCDLSLSLGEEVKMAGTGETQFDPFQMIIDNKDKLLIDDSPKSFEQISNKGEAIAKAIEANTAPVKKCSCHRLANLAGVPLQNDPAAPEGGEAAAAPAAGAKGAPPPPPPPPAPPAPDGAPEEPKPPCPAKMVLPQSVNFDIVCDNAGYELFTDLCFAHFLIAQEMAQKIRFHVKNIPWFVSDVTVKDFNALIEKCAGASFSKTITEPAPPPAADGAVAEATTRTVTSAGVQSLAKTWKQYLSDGTFVVMDESYWTWPVVYKDMKKYDYNLYRKLQYCIGILFKGDLNYRKLLGERNCNPYAGFEPSLQGFIPAPILAARTVKADLICGMPKGKYEILNGLDPKWMEKGDYGVIQFCAKAEPLKPSDRPCIDYGTTCFGVTCAVHNDM